MHKKLVYYLALFTVLILLDQGSKWFLISYLKTQESYILNLYPILDFVYVWNYGISFGLFGEYYQYSNIVFSILSSAIIIYLIYLIVKEKSVLGKHGIALIISGAVANLIDRILHGAVFDFIYLHYHSYAFPAFNLADSFITVGAMLLFYANLACLTKQTAK